MHTTIIFDVDGTLLDGTEGIIKSVKYTINKLKLPELSDNQLTLFVGPPIQNSAKNIFKLNDNDAQEFADIFRNQYASGDVFSARVYDGIYELLDYLKRNNIKTGVATYKREDYAIALMKHFNFEKYFTSICGADNNNKLSKLNILENCIANFTLNKKEVIMIGDSLHDAEAAQKAGVEFIGVTYGFGFKTANDVNKYPNLFYANSPIEIIEKLKIQKS